MNTVLLTSSPDTSPKLKGAASRPSPDPASAPDDAAGFANVLASQAATPTQHNNPEPQTVSTPATGPQSKADNPATQPVSPAPHAGQRLLVAQADHALQADIHSGTASNHTIAGLRSPNNSNSASAAQHTTGNTLNNPDVDSTLPARFSQIVTAISTLHDQSEITAPHTKTDLSATQNITTGQAEHQAAFTNNKPGHASRIRAQAIDSLSHRSDNPTLTRLESDPDVRTAPAPEQRVPGHSDRWLETLVLKQNDTASAHSGNSLFRTAPTSESVSDILSGSGIIPSPAFSLNPGVSHPQHIMATPAMIPQPVFSKQWGPELGRQFTSIIRPGENGSHIAELRLDPPELGPLRITININDSVVQAVFTSAHAVVRNAVEQALPHLQQQLEHEGLSLGHTSVDHDDSPAQTHAEYSGTPKTLTSLSHLPETSATTDPAPQRRSDALVDTFA